MADKSDNPAPDGHQASFNHLHNQLNADVPRQIQFLTQTNTTNTQLSITPIYTLPCHTIPLPHLQTLSPSPPNNLVRSTPLNNLDTPPAMHSTYTPYYNHQHGHPSEPSRLTGSMVSLPQFPAPSLLQIEQLPPVFHQLLPQIRFAGLQNPISPQTFGSSNVSTEIHRKSNARNCSQPNALSQTRRCCQWLNSATGRLCFLEFDWTPPYLQLCPDHADNPYRSFPSYFVNLILGLHWKIIRCLLPRRDVPTGNSTLPENWCPKHDPLMNDSEDDLSDEERLALLPESLSERMKSVLLLVPIRQFRGFLAGPNSDSNDADVPTVLSPVSPPHGCFRCMENWI